MSDHNDTERNSPLLLVAFWLYVLIPLAWGVSNTVTKSLALFH